MTEIVPYSLIVAVAKNAVIGIDNRLPWHLPEDLKWFKEQTLGKPIVMGRKTFESLPGVLPKRPHVVISRHKPLTNKENVYWVANVEQAKNQAQDLAEQSKSKEIMVVGGAEIYRQFMPFISRIYRTLVDVEPEGDAYFSIDELQWQVSSQKKNIIKDIRFLHQVLVMRG